MGSLREHIARFRKNLTSILNGSHSHIQLNEVISLSHAFAVILLKKKLSSGKLNLTLVHLDLHDLAYDCIAELFRTDEPIALIQIKSYFSSIQIDQLSDVQLTDHLRRLVFSKVNQGIFRIYFEYDPSLGKILRNIKLSIQALNNFIEVDRFGDTFLVPALVEPHFQLPILPKEILQELLHDELNGSERIPEVLSKLSIILQGQTVYAKAISLVGFAVALRTLFLEEIELSAERTVSPSNDSDVLELIRSTTDKIQNKFAAKYIGKQKVSNEEYEIMFTVIRKNLIAIAVENDGKDFSLYEHFGIYKSGLTKEEYTKEYKAILEYLFHLTKTELGKQLKKNF